jgi:glycosyltransferase involved in cell wall biosynthesis
MNNVRLSRRDACLVRAHEGELTLKIAHLITGGETGGSKKHVISLLQKWKNEEVCLILLQEGSFADEARKAGLWVEVFTQQSRYDVRILLRISRFLREQSFQILHTHGPRANFFGIFLKARGTFTWVTTVHSDPSLDFIGVGFSGKVFTSLNLFALRRADHYFAITNFFKQKLLSFGITPDRITIVYNGIDYGLPKVTDFELKQSLNFSPDDFVLLIVGRLHPIKGHRELFEAIAQLPDKKNVKVLVVGDGPIRSELLAFSKTLGLGESVHFLGHRTDIQELYSISDVGLLTSYSESFPLVMLECANEAKPMIATDVGGVRELLVDDTYGWVIPSRSAVAIRDAIVDAMESKKSNTLANKGAALRERAMAHFSLQSLADATMNTYSSLMK